MQKRENDEDITNMDTPTVVAYDSKKYLHGSKKAWIMHEKDGL
jgi:hypothetical protein